MGTDGDSRVGLKGKSITEKAHFVADLLRNKWVVITAAIWLQCCNGSSYNFGMYSGTLKSALNYDQAGLDTIAASKDLGANIGIFAGCVFDYVSPAGVLIIGAAESFFGYLMLWLSVSGKIHAEANQLWQTSLYIFFAANGQTFFNTAAIVTCVQNFPTNRGVIIGLLKGLVGLSGALISQLYHAIYPEDEDGSSMLILLTWLPSLVAVVIIPLLRPPPSNLRQQSPEEVGQLQARERSNLFLLSVMALMLAAYLMAVIIAQSFITFTHSSYTFVCAPSIAVLLILPAALAVKDLVDKYMLRGESSSPYMTVAAAPLPQNSLKEPLIVSHDIDEEDNIEGSDDEEDKKFPMPTNTAGDPANGVQDRRTVVRPYKGVQRGQDHSFSQAVVTADFWLLFMGALCGMGSGLTAMDNMGQIGQSLGYTDIGTFVSLMSIWNFLGRFGFGALSEFLLHRYGFGRPNLLMWSQVAMCLAHALIGSAIPGSLYAGSILIGLCYGAQWSVMPTVSSEIFGLARFATLFNTITIASPLGAYFFSVQVAGRLYDRESKKINQQPFRRSSSNFSSQFLNILIASADQEKECYGARCFRLTFIIMAVVSLTGAMFYMLLARRTSQFYSRELYEQMAYNSEESDSAHQQTTTRNEG